MTKSENRNDYSYALRNSKLINSKSSTGSPISNDKGAFTEVGISILTDLKV